MVTGDLIEDDSTMQKWKGQKMQRIGKHYSTTEGKQMLGHSLMQSVYIWTVGTGDS
jgi:hypothetical protein